MAKKYVVTLTDAEREHLLAMTTRGRGAARQLSRAHILLHANAGANDDAIAHALHIGTATVERTRKRFVEGGLERALNESPRPGGKRKLLGASRKRMWWLWPVAILPRARSALCMRLLADKLVEVGIVEQISDETVRRTLKKGTLSRG